MVTKRYEVRAMWDREASVWVAYSDDIHGLSTEADTFERLIDRVMAVAPELLALNNQERGEGVEVHIIGERREHLATAA